MRSASDSDMNDPMQQEICAALATEIGMALSLRDNNKDAEATFNFTDLGRDGGINFTIAPGLNRFSVIARPGGFSKICLEQIRRASSEQVANATAHIAIATDYASDSLRIYCSGIHVSSPEDVGSWFKDVADDLQLTLVRRGFDDPNSEETTREVIGRLLIPVVAAFAELIGYERTHSALHSEDPDAQEIEGEKFVATVIRRERSRLNRSMCIRIHGCRCTVCGFSFAEFYGQFMEGFIEVHHLEPVSALQQARIYDPAKDLIPLCANCHRAIHSRTPPVTPDELISLIASTKKVTTQ
jgi:5-methylcytosine-specific restriction protein A